MYFLALFFTLTVEQIFLPDKKHFNFCSLYYLLGILKFGDKTLAMTLSGPFPVTVNSPLTLLSLGM
jgi:hypothetical protein